MLAFVAVLVIGGSGIALAGGPASGYAPKSAVIVGPTTVSRSAAPTAYTLRVTYTDGTMANITTTGVFTATNGTFSGNTFTAGSSSKVRISGSDTELGVTVTAGVIINVTP